MFNDKRIERIEGDIRQLNIKVEAMLVKVQNTLDKFANENDKKFVDFHREIASQYFNTLEKIFRFNKEISLIDKLSQQIGEKDIAKLQASLLQPILETRWQEKERAQGAKIEKTWGVKIIERRKQLHEQQLQMERQEQSKEKIDWIKARIAELDEIIQEAK